MTRRSRPRTWPWPDKDVRGRKGRRGSMTMTAVFLYFSLTAIGLGLVTLAAMYQRAGSLRATAFRMSFSAENGAKQAYAVLAATVSGRNSPTEISPERFSELREATAAGKNDAAEEALGLDFPLEISEAAGKQAWTASLGLASGRWEDRDGFFLAEFRSEAKSEGRVAGAARRKTARLEANLGILAGRIPLAAVPLLVAGPDGPESLGGLVARGKVELRPAGSRRRIPGPMATASPLIPADATSALAETLKVKIFSPGKLTKAQLRQALGLEMVNEPVPDGVYLVANDAGLGGVFVQGDVEELLLAAKTGWQYAQFKLEEGTWHLKFNPSLGKAVFIEPGGERAFDRTPLPIIMVNGKILSLGGGTVEADGTVALSTDPSVPSLVDGVSLSLVCADEVTITSHLIQEGVRWMDGLPYLKDSRSQLVLYASGRDFIDGTERSGKIKVGSKAPRDLQIQAAVAARGGFAVEKGAGDVVIAGSLQAGALEPGASKIRITPDERLLSGGAAAAASPRSTIPLLWIASLEPLQWFE